MTIKKEDSKQSIINVIGLDINQQSKLNDYEQNEQKFVENINLNEQNNCDNLWKDELIKNEGKNEAKIDNDKEIESKFLKWYILNDY